MLKDTVLELAKKYDTPMAFVKAEAHAYKHALRNGWIDLCYAHMATKRTKWTIEKIAEAATAYSKRGDFKKGNNAAYIKARRLGLLDKVCAHMDLPPTQWTLALCKQEAGKYATRTDFIKGTSSAYQAALSKGWLDECCEHMQCGIKRSTEHRRIWDLSTLLQEAAKWSTRGEFKTNAPGAYRAALRMGVLNLAQKDKPFVGKKCDNDAVYIWKAIGLWYNGEQVYKIGKTSARLDHQRIFEVAKTAEVQPEMELLVKVKDAHVAEKKMLRLGQNPKYIRFDGSTEFRAMTDFELTQAKLIATALS